MVTAYPSLDFFPVQAGGRVSQQVGFSSGQFLDLPFMNGYRLGRGCEIIPEIFDELKFLGGA